MAGRLTLAASLGGPIIAVVSYGVTRVGYEEYFAPLGLTPDVVGLGQAAIVSRPAVAVGVVAFAVTTWFGVGAISYRLIAPIALRQENEATTSFAWVKLLGLALGLTWPAFSCRRSCSGCSWEEVQGPLFGLEGR